jgi:hypothetical protein
LLWRRYDATFTVAQADSPYDGDLVLTNNSANARRAQISIVCIEPVSGVWPGYEDSDSGEWQDTCFKPVEPDTFDPAQWLSYVGRWFGYMWTCVISPLWQRLLTYVSTAVTGLGLLGRWLGALVGRFSGFVAGLVAAAAQALLNSLAAVLAAAWAALIALPFVQWLFDLGALAATAAGLLGTLITTFIALLGAVASFVVTLVGVIAGTWASIVAAINSTAPDVGMANCGNPSDPLIGLCYGLQAVADFLAEFPILTASIYVLAGNIGLFTMVWTMRSVGSTLGDV